MLALALDTTATILLKVTGQGAVGANDVTATGMLVEAF
jgi:hypothetical protein